MTDTETVHLVNPIDALEAEESFKELAYEPNEAQEQVLPGLVQIAEEAGFLETAKRLENLRVWLSQDLASFEEQLSYDPSGIDNVATQSSKHLVNAAGKRIRPLCVILSARLGERSADLDVLDLAVAAELVHAATLLHDDVLDEGETRRGVPTARMVFGNSASILGGDHLLVTALQRVQRGGTPELLNSLLKTISSMVHAEAIQLERRGRFEPDPQTYDTVVTGKTAELFRWSMEAGARLGGLSEAQINSLASYGHNLGMAFQLVDDTLDLSSNTDTMGKDGLRDLKEGKMTWPLILACKKDAGLNQLLTDSVQIPGFMDDDHSVAKLVDRILATDCLEATRQRARDYAHEAQAVLTSFPNSPAKDALSTLLDGAVVRVY